MELNNFIFAIFIIIFGYFLNYYLLLIFNKSKTNLLIDGQFKKPQAFHEALTYRLGGLSFSILLSLVFLYLFIYKNILSIEYISFCALFFLIGFADDLEINIRPKFRLIIMIFFLLALIIYNNFKLDRISVEYLDNLMSIDLFALFFVTLCFLLIINGSNLIDGINGLLCLHTFIIFSILFSINIKSGNQSFSLLLFYICLITLITIKFNFPKAQMFLGDAGAYLLGALIAVSTIMSNNLNTSISSFFFSILLFYLFFEVFFSFFRKIFYAKQNPLLPDNKHLHMLLYKYLLKKNRKQISNYKVSIYINLTYIFLIIPPFILMKNSLFCKIYFLSLPIIYIYFYIMINKKLKKIN